jgi:3-phosphoshikimate 1-carboxyvinyltransferase
MLRAFGVQVEVGEDELLVVGGMPLSADVTVDSFGDHRIAMAAAVAGLAREGSTEIKGWSAVNTSYKGFVRDLNSLIQPMSFDG